MHLTYYNTKSIMIMTKKNGDDTLGKNRKTKRNK